MIQHATATALTATRGTAPSPRTDGGRDFLSLLASSAGAAPSRPAGTAGTADVPEDRKVAAPVLDASTVEPDDAALTGAWFVASMPPALAATATAVELDPDLETVVATEAAGDEAASEAAVTDLAPGATPTDHGTELPTEDGPSIQAPAEGRAGPTDAPLASDVEPTRPAAGTGDADAPAGDASGSLADLGTTEVEPGEPGPVVPAGGESADRVVASPPARGEADEVPAAAPRADAETADPRRADAPAGAERGAPRVAMPGAETATIASMDAPTSGRADGGRAAEATVLTSSALTRLLDAIEQLEHAPPPRQLTLELGEVRVRLAMEDGALRLQLLGEQRSEDRELLRDAEEALLARGFDLRGEGGRGDRPADHPSADHQAEQGLSRPRAAARTASRLPPVGLHL